MSPAGNTAPPAGRCAVYHLDDHRTPAVVLTGPAPGAREPSERQLAIGELMSIGLKDAAIARVLDLSVRTVRAEIGQLVTALGARSRFQAGCLLVRRYG